jgi:hypothetical protein
VADPHAPRPAVRIDPAEERRARRDSALFKLLAGLGAVVTVVIAAAWRQPVAATAAATAAGLALWGSWWALSGVRRRLRPVWDWERARSARGLPIAFGRRCGWLAARGATPEALLAALPLARARRVGWRDGIRAAYAGKVFVTPALGGWTLAVSPRLPDAGDGRVPAPLVSFLSRVSRDLATEVQSFAMNEAVGYTHWARAEHGRVLCARAYVELIDKTLVDLGGPAADPPERGVPGPAAVAALAARWSLDPAALDGWQEPVGDGWLGELEPDAEDRE